MKDVSYFSCLKDLSQFKVILLENINFASKIKNKLQNHVIALNKIKKSKVSLKNSNARVLPDNSCCASSIMFPKLEKIKKISTSPVAPLLEQAQ